MNHYPNSASVVDLTAFTDSERDWTPPEEASFLREFHRLSLLRNFNADVLLCGGV